MTELLAGHVEQFAAHAHYWGFLMVFVFMAVESSFIPFPSEIVMIPAGFMAARAELLFGIPSLDLVLAVLCGMLGSLLGAYFNYYLSLKLGRPILFRYGKYVFLKPETIESAEAVFRKYGDITTFACRLLPAIRQLISIPAGLSKMHLGKFSFYTALGAGIWSAVLGGIGWYLASLAGNTTYRDMVFKGRDLLKTHFLWILIGLAAAIALYALSHALVAKAAKKTADGA